MNGGDSVERGDLPAVSPGVRAVLPTIQIIVTDIWV